MIYLDDADFRLYCGDVVECLREIADESVHMCITSPPYWNLRDYGTGTWEGGDPECDHLRPSTTMNAGFNERWGQGAGERKQEKKSDGQYPRECAKCGAQRFDRQIGLEATPDEYVERMVEVFREVRRVLRADGTVWLNIGDSYVSDGALREAGAAKGQVIDGKRAGKGTGTAIRPPAVRGLKQKDMVGIPWMLAFALRADGWYLRSEVIWHKTNAMPASYKDRPTTAHESLFLLAKSQRYFYDYAAVREPAEWQRWGDQTNGKHEGSQSAASWIGSKSKLELQGGRQASEPGQYDGNDFKTTDERSTRFQGPNPTDGARNQRTVWPIPTQPYSEAHFATFPEELVRRCIFAGTSEHGCCPECGAPWQRVVETDLVVDHELVRGRTATKDAEDEGDRGAWGTGEQVVGSLNVKTVGWEPGCHCGTRDDTRRPPSNVGAGEPPLTEPDRGALPPVPCTVLDPFMGSGTVAHVARRFGRRAVGVELNAEYCDLAARRTQQQSLFA